MLRNKLLIVVIVTYFKTITKRKVSKFGAHYAEVMTAKETIEFQVIVSNQKETVEIIVTDNGERRCGEFGLHRAR